MIKTLWNKVSVRVQTPMGHDQKKEFNDSLYKINIARGKITAVAFFILELLTTIASIIIKKVGVLKKPDIYYIYMYVIMAFAMLIFLYVFIKQEKKYQLLSNTVKNITEVLFSSFILGWCAGITLLDQLSGGEIIVYMIAAIAIAVTPIYRPQVLFGLYFVFQLLFLLLLPSFNMTGGHIFGRMINSTTILLISWAISYMRYRNRAEDFLNRMKLQENTRELMRLNKELEEANKKLEIMSQTDVLTGVYNRLMFDKVLKKEWKRCKKHQKPISLFMVDIDYFKAFNDHYGHQAGDFCLKQVADALAECTERASDMVIRYGGEEFAVILPDMEEEEAFELAQKMVASVEALRITHEFSSVSDFVTISLGVDTVIPADSSTIEELIKNSDMALYEAKNNNRNQVVVA